ncbi:TIM-barrel domain-containing protein [Rubrivirga sp.]|uniref:glycoside hydrolase family 31 protein n=1 Tax=Rubrivirga sp. TaxID=1885344 RepID=UPI003B52C72B
MSSPLLAPAETVGALVVPTPVGALHLDALSDDVVRVRHVRPGQVPSARPSYALDPDARWDGPSAWAARDGGDVVEVETAALRIRVTAETGAFVVTERAGGRVLVDGHALPDEGVGHTVSLEPADRLFGLGDKALSLDRRGHWVELWNTDAYKYQRGTDPLYKSVPFVLKQGEEAAAGLFYDNTFRARFDLGASDAGRMAYHADGGALDLYVVHGPTPLGVVEAYARLTGRTPMLPRWALGYHQCRYSYMNEAEVREVAASFRERRIPCDALYFDIHYMDGYRVFTWDRERFPDPPGLLADLDADGFRSVVIIDPGVKADDPDYAVYRQGQDRDAFVRYPDGAEVHGEVWPGRCAFPDFTDPDVRDWWGGLHEGLVRDGVDGIWNDMNEPALFSVAHVEGSMDAEHDVGTIPDEARHALDGEGGSHAQAHNVYGMQMQRATHEGLTQLAPDRRPFTITRAAYAGSQRFGTSWTGDNSATWDHLRLAIQTCLSLGVSGMTFTGADVGGFVGHPTGELLARWTQVGALTPLFRNHSAVDTPRQEPWLFGDEVGRVCRQAIELRYRLLPTLYTALWQAATHGTPILRPLPLVHPTDETVRRTSPLAFYVGDSLLAHPVVEEGQAEREIYLPDADAGWVDFWTGERLEGRQSVWTATPLDRVPLYVRAGSVLALGPVRQHSGEPVERLELRVYPARGRYTSWLYEDAGDGHGDAWLGRLDLADDGAAVRLACSVVGAHVPEWAGWDVVVHGLDAAPARVTVDGAEVEAMWDGAARFPVPVGASVEILR